MGCDLMHETQRFHELTDALEKEQSNRSVEKKEEVVRYTHDAGWITEYAFLADFTHHLTKHFPTYTFCVCRNQREQYDRHFIYISVETSTETFLLEYDLQFQGEFKGVYVYAHKWIANQQEIDPLYLENWKERNEWKEVEDVSKDFLVNMNEYRLIFVTQYF